MNHLKKHIKVAVLAGMFGLVFGAFFSVMAVSSSIEDTLGALDLKGDPDDGALIYEESCQSCHLPAANGDPAGAFPQLASQHSTVIIKRYANLIPFSTTRLKSI